MENRKLLVVGLLALSIQAGAAGIYRCTSPSGAVTFQEIACRTSESGGVTNIPTSFPAVNTAEHDNILRQVAMLDERELRRYEIDSRERIARDDRIAREHEAEAMMASAASDSGVYAFGAPLYAIGQRGAHLVPIVNHRTFISHRVARGVH